MNLKMIKNIKINNNEYEFIGLDSFYWLVFSKIKKAKFMSKQRDIISMTYYSYKLYL